VQFNVSAPVKESEMNVLEFAAELLSSQTRSLSSIRIPYRLSSSSRFDQIYSFSRDALIKSIRRPENVAPGGEALSLHYRPVKRNER
jgi:hypothetical protein